MDPFWFLRKKKKGEIEEYDPLANYYNRKTLDEMVEMYKTEESYLKYLANNVKSGKLSEEDYKELKRIEDEIIKKTSDEFEKKVLRILADKRFNIVELMNKKWDEETKIICRDVCHYLRFGNIYPLESYVFKPLPLPGHEFFSWLLSNAGEDKNDRNGNIFSAVGAMLKENRILDQDYSVDRIKRENLPPADSIFGRIIVIFAGEFARQVNIIIDIWKMEDGKGKEYIENISKDMP